ncbi:hypothetical protein CHH28_14625 [Bacterioplanes sanyensis]|uniref:Uncharacterized protein n=1 Tax=Bacterioplanes sanyensis TaxID=1249553 RepID=A0A222FN82_9GAMM|nr:hypothetical protein CHH28_14625 [Bacterioplanes sanyensis]
MPEHRASAGAMRAMIGRGGRTIDDASSQRSIVSRNGRTQMEVVRHRSNSVTNFHMHGRRMGAITHTDRRGRTYRMNAFQHNNQTRALTRQAHGY